MTDRPALYKYVSDIAYAYILILVKIMIGTIDILPDFIGYIMIVYSFSYLKNECRTIMLLKPLGIILTLWSFVTFIINLFGIKSITVPAAVSTSAALYIIYIIGIIISIINIYFDYQLFTEMSFLAEKYQKKDGTLRKKLITRRNINTVSLTIAFLINNIAPIFNNIPEDIFNIMMIVPTLMSLAVMFLIVSALFSLRKILKNDEITDKENNEESLSQPPDASEATTEEKYI